MFPAPPRPVEYGLLVAGRAFPSSRPRMSSTAGEDGVASARVTEVCLILPTPPLPVEAKASLPRDWERSGVEVVIGWEKRRTNQHGQYGGK